jgi:hypothetical protein
VVQPEQGGNAFAPQKRQQRVATEPTICQGQITWLEGVEQAVEQAQFVLMLVAAGIIEERARGETE